MASPRLTLHGRALPVLHESMPNWFASIDAFVSTTFAENASFAWFADFDVAQVEEGAKSGAFHVRAVRDADR